MMKLFAIIINDHIRSQRIFVELGLVLLTAFLVLRHLNDSYATQATFALYSFLTTLYTTSVFADSNEQPSALQRILAVSSRQTMLWAIALSALSVAVASYLLLLLIGTVLNPLAMPPIGVTLLALPSMILIMVTAIVLMLLMTPLVATTSQRLLVLLIITIPVAWNIAVTTINLSIPQADGAWVAAVTTFWGVMLWPSFAVYNNAVTPDYTLMSLLFHVIHALIIIMLARVGRSWFDRKPLIVA